MKDEGMKAKEMKKDDRSHEGTVMHDKDMHKDGNGMIKSEDHMK
jgi:hypothetical protein